MPERTACWETGGQRAGDLIVRTVADEERAGRRHMEFLACKQIDIGIRLGEADHTGEDHDLKVRMQRRLLPVGHVFSETVSHDSQLESSCSQAAEGCEDLRLDRVKHTRLLEEALGPQSLEQPFIRRAAERPNDPPQCIREGTATKNYL
jgi:hypothetical protein